MDAAADPLRCGLIGVSPTVRDLRAFIPKVAATNCNVLITGETGTGKECVAQAIHRNSPRAARSLVCINCAAVPDTLMESELFGYEKGAFTGANSRFEGRLGLANHSTLFLDEIGDMSLQSQAKILRAVENREFYRIGARTPESVDIRIVAATNQNLLQLVEEKQFRRDLYYRLNVAHIALPPLRERREDVSLLLCHFLQQLGQTGARSVGRPSGEVLALLERYEWPGNIRELKNLAEWLTIDAPEAILIEHLPAHIRSIALSPDVPRTERESLLRVLLETNWNKSKAAERLQWSRMTVYRKVKKYQLESHGLDT